MIEILYFAGCPNHEPTLELTRSVIGEIGLEAEIREIPVESAEEAEAHRFFGSPTVRVNGQDIEPGARDRTDFGLTCRIYGDAGVPPRELLVRAVRESARG